MAEFSPLKDYFGLNALVSKIAREELMPSSSKTSRPPTANSSSSLGVHRNTYEGTDRTAKLEDFDIRMMSRVYKERMTNVRRRRKPLTHCVFCKNNAESVEVYASHTLKDDYQKISCPILRAYTCPICGASGDYAHTIKYCPFRVQGQGQA